MSSRLLALNDPLQSPLRKTPTTAAFSRAVVCEIWNLDFTPQQYREYKHLYESYFTHIYRDLSMSACSGDSQIPDLTHGQILEIVHGLKTQPWTKLEAARSFYLYTGCNDAERVARAITLAAGLLVPLNFKCVGGARRGEAISWEDGDCLSQTVAKRVITMTRGSGESHNNCMSCNSGWTFSTRFNARQLERVTGFQIIWTSNFLDHLLVQDDDEEVKIHIFHHVKVLENHLKFEKLVIIERVFERRGTYASTSTIISPELVSETLDTLALLIPRTDCRVRKWYTQLGKLYTLDPSVLSLEYLNPENRGIDHFVFWGSRLRKLKQVFDDHEPEGPLQWWRDDRKPVQWWTFWIAALVLVLTIVFGFIQSVTSILQLIKS